MPLAISYRRFSKLKQAKGDSADRQGDNYQQALRDLKEHNLTPGEVFFDKGLSGYTGRNEEGELGKILAMVKAGQFPKGSWLIADKTRHTRWRGPTGDTVRNLFKGVAFDLNGETMICDSKGDRQSRRFVSSADKSVSFPYAVFEDQFLRLVNDLTLADIGRTVLHLATTSQPPTQVAVFSFSAVEELLRFRASPLASGKGDRLSACSTKWRTGGGYEPTPLSSCPFGIWPPMPFCGCSMTTLGKSLRTCGQNSMGIMGQ